MFSHPESCELGCFVLGNGNGCLCAGRTNISGTQEWFALNSPPSRVCCLSRIVLCGYYSRCASYLTLRCSEHIFSYSTCCSKYTQIIHKKACNLAYLMPTLAHLRSWEKHTSPCLKSEIAATDLELSSRERLGETDGKG